MATNFMAGGSLSKSFWFATTMTAVLAFVCYNIINDRIVSAMLVGYMCLGLFVVGVADIWGRKGW